MSVLRPDERASGVHVQLLELRRRFAAVSALT